MFMEDDKSSTERKLNGVAVLKPEYIIKSHERVLSVDCIAEKDKCKLEITDNSEESNGQPAKKLKLSKREKKLKGQNKNRGPTFKQPSRENLLCPHLIEGSIKCPLDRCVYIHDVKQYLASKPPDIGQTCPIFSVRGFCPRGITCRFGSQHIDADGKSVVDALLEEKWSSDKSLQTLNAISKAVQIDLRKRKYDFKKSEQVVSYLDKRRLGKKELCKSEEEEKSENDESKTIINREKPIGPVDTTSPSFLNSREKKQINWKDKLYLSPLTTVGNLPFRRICKEFGVDITCGEMAMASNILQGTNQEWALIKRHGSEDLFGAQVCGNNPNTLSRCAQVLQEQASIDFVDINMGCPIDLVYQQGSGSGLMRRERILFSVVESMNNVLDIPLTIKMRTGVYSDKNTAHNLIGGLKKAGVSLITVHGRSREQRYTRRADWDYIEQCAQLATPIPLFGNGDILSFIDYQEARERSPSVAGVVIGRGALIKPWIFTEIKEQRIWDISSRERFEILKKYTNYGLQHWGSDTKGVENTRRFLLEWISFLHRYIPVGLLEHPPQKINERPPCYQGRDDMETLMASPSCNDWIKISETLLGPVPDGFVFLPKHKANSWK